MNALDYIIWRGDVPFEMAPMNRVDLFLLSQLAVPNLSGIADGDTPVTVAKAAEMYFASHSEDVSNLGSLQSVTVLPAFREMGKSARFGGLTLRGFVNIVDAEKVEQFCAVTVGNLPGGTTCVSFRGTDDTFIGWKENCYMAVLDVIPAQQDAAQYLARVGEETTGPLFTCGHSKGGNLAVYAACSVPEEIRRRIHLVTSFDGPGFMPSFLENESYRDMETKVETVLPQHSTVGTILTMAGTPRLVTSTVSGPMAHDGFKWETTPTGFVTAEKQAAASRVFDNMLDSTVENMTVEERKAAIDSLFEPLMESGAATISEFRRMNPIAAVKILANVVKNKSVDGLVREMLEQLLRAIV